MNSPVEIVFPRDKVNPGVRNGDVVSIDENGHLKQGAGTTIYRNIQEIQNKTMYHLHTVVIGETIHVAQYDSEMLVSVVDPHTDAIIATETFPLPIIEGTAHNIDDLIVLNGNIVLSLGNMHCVPCRVDYVNNSIQVEFGKITQPIPRMNIQPEMRVLNDTCAIISYYGVENRITLVGGCLTDNENGMEMRWGEVHEYSEDYIFHDIIGFSGTRFMVVHARVPWWTASSQLENNNPILNIAERQMEAMNKNSKKTDSRIHYGLGTLHANLSASVGDIYTIERNSFGFMDMAQ